MRLRRQDHAEIHYDEAWGFGPARNIVAFTGDDLTCRPEFDVLAPCGSHRHALLRRATVAYMIGVPVGLLYANAGEWLLHKYVLHRLGRNRNSFWRYHWLHHGQARRNDFRDPDYEQSVFQWNAQGKEALSLCALAALHLPLLPVAPWFTLTALFSAYDYYRKHKRAHLDPDWAKAHLPWHWDHHLGPNPEANYCVTRPWFDDLLGTRERLAPRDASG